MHSTRHGAAHDADLLPARSLNRVEPLRLIGCAVRGWALSPSESFHGSPASEAQEDRWRIPFLSITCQSTGRIWVRRTTWPKEETAPEQEERSSMQHAAVLGALLQGGGRGFESLSAHNEFPA